MTNSDQGQSSRHQLSAKRSGDWLIRERIDVRYHVLHTVETCVIFGGWRYRTGYREET